MTTWYSGDGWGLVQPNGKHIAKLIQRRHMIELPRRSSHG